MESKEESVLGLFFEYPTKEWRFSEILNEAKIARSKASNWLKLFIKDGFVKRVKERSKAPYYVGNYESENYRNKKKMFALNKFYEVGLLNHLTALQKASTVIIFGSFSRWDWYKGSDIDIFIYGDPEGLRIAEYELRLHKEIQLFICQNNDELKKFGAGLIKNIIKGYLVKGGLDFVKVGLNA